MRIFFNQSESSGDEQSAKKSQKTPNVGNSEVARILSWQRSNFEKSSHFDTFVFYYFTPAVELKNKAQLHQRTVGVIPMTTVFLDGTRGALREAKSSPILPAYCTARLKPTIFISNQIPPDIFKS